MDRSLRRETAALTIDDVNAAIRKHIKPETVSLFAAGDFAKAAAKPATPAAASGN